MALPPPDKQTYNSPTQRNVDLGLKFFYFGPYVVQMKLPKECGDIFLYEGEKSRKKGNRIDKNLAGNLYGQFDLDNSCPEILYYIKQFVESYCESHNIYWNVHKKLRPNDWFIADLWINYMRAGDYNPIHNHAGDLSFVFFPAPTPNELKEEVKNFKGTTLGPGVLSILNGEIHNLTNNEVNVLPEQGDLFVFPAHVKHMVYGFKSNCTRVSVSGNIFLPNSPALISNLRLTPTIKENIKQVSYNNDHNLRYYKGDRTQIQGS